MLAVPWMKRFTIAARAETTRIALAITRASRRARDTRSVTQTVAIYTSRTNDTAHAAVIPADRA